MAKRRLRPGLARVFARVIDARISELADRADEELLGFALKGRGGRRVESFLGQAVHSAFACWLRDHKPRWLSELRLRSPTGRLFRLDAVHDRYSVAVELKPKSISGMAAGKARARFCATQLRKRTVVFFYEYAPPQKHALLLLKERISLQSRKRSTGSETLSRHPVKYSASVTRPDSPRSAHCPG
jgi:hypothetical protein